MKNKFLVLSIALLFGLSTTVCIAQTGNSNNKAKTEIAVKKAKKSKKTKKLSKKERLALEKNKKDFNNAMKKGDGAFFAKDYLNAKNAYATASMINPDATEPKQKISLIEEWLSKTADPTTADVLKTAQEKQLQAENELADKQKIIDSLQQAQLEQMKTLKEELEQMKRELLNLKEQKKEAVDVATTEIKPKEAANTEKSIKNFVPNNGQDSSKAKQPVVQKTQAQVSLVPFMSSGRWFNTPNTEKHHQFTVSEISEIVTIITKSDKISPSKWYTLSSGLQVQILHSDEWLGLVMGCYLSIDDNITDKEEFLQAVNASDTATWNCNMPLTKNYYWSAKTSKVEFIKDYTGTTFKAPVITYKGSPVIKRSCGNPELLSTTKVEIK